MTATLTKSFLFVLMASGAISAAEAQAEGDSVYGDAKYRLQIEPGNYRLQADPAYQLATEFQKLKPAPTPELPRGQATRLPHLIALQPYAREIEFASLGASVDPALVHAVIHVESRYRPDAVSPKGALGLMQVMPGTAARYGVRKGRPTVQKNLDVGTRYLRDLMEMFDHRLELVLAAYNAGEGAVRKYSDKIPPYRETQSYVRAVLAKYAELGGVTGTPGLQESPAAKRIITASQQRTAVR
jgi:soluble lytic murein transglycosylase-like protein